MIYNIVELTDKYHLGLYPTQKIAKLRKNGIIATIKNGMYSDDPEHDTLPAACEMFPFAYLSFEYALAKHGLIPERINSYTCAASGLQRRYIIESDLGVYTYRNVPFDFSRKGISYMLEGCSIAGPEKALLDMLHVVPSVRSLKSLRVLLFEDLRIDEIEFERLDKQLMVELCDLYPGYTAKLLKKIIQKEIRDGRQYLTDFGVLRLHYAS